MGDRFNFLTPRGRYYGKFTPKNLMFNANLQEFSHRVGIICSLETGGKLTPEESYEEIQKLWKQLKRSKKELGIGEESA
jgi:sigma54-dependent transcription regulator